MNTSILHPTIFQISAILAILGFSSHVAIYIIRWAKAKEVRCFEELQVDRWFVRLGQIALLGAAAAFSLALENFGAAASFMVSIAATLMYIAITEDEP